MRVQRFSPRRIFTLVGVAVSIAVGIAVFSQRASLRVWFAERPYRTTLPSAEPANSLVASSTAPASPAPTQQINFLPRTLAPSKAGAVNLSVPFAPQAPFGNWAQPYQDACEEAAIIMIERFFRGASLSLQAMDTEILRMVKFQEERYGFYIDSNAAETARLTEEFYPHLSARVITDPSVNDIREALEKRIPVLALVNGQKLGNPFYTPPGPDRHALTIKGVTGDKFITNDPGTRRGADFVYPMSTVMNALEDYDGGSPGTGRPVILLLTPKR